MSVVDAELVAGEVRPQVWYSATIRKKASAGIQVQRRFHSKPHAVSPISSALLSSSASAFAAANGTPPAVILLLAVASVLEWPKTAEPRKLPIKFSVHPRQSHAFSAIGSRVEIPDVMPTPLNRLVTAEKLSYTSGPAPTSDTELSTPSALNDAYLRPNDVSISPPLQRKSHRRFASKSIV